MVHPERRVRAGRGPVHTAARREFAEELGTLPPQHCEAEYVPLGEVRQSAKIVIAWAVLGDLDVSTVRSNTVEIDWPPRSGRRLTVPEIDRAAWVDLATARVKLISAQTAFLDRLPWVDPTKFGIQSNVEESPVV